jgi:hypothetical protein
MLDAGCWMLIIFNIQSSIVNHQVAGRPLSVASFFSIINRREPVLLQPLEPVFIGIAHGA